MPNPFAEGGIFRDPEAMQALAGNPMFNIGMGLLASSQDKNINPFVAMTQGLQTAGEQQRLLDEDERAEQMRKALAEYFGTDLQGIDRARAFMGVPPQQMAPGPQAYMQGGTPQPRAEPFQDYFSLGWGDILNQRY